MGLVSRIILALALTGASACLDHRDGERPAPAEDAGTDAHITEDAHVLPPLEEVDVSGPGDAAQPTDAGDAARQEEACTVAIPATPEPGCRISFEWYNDFQGAFGKRFYNETFPIIRQFYGDDLDITLRHFPLEAIHSYAWRAAEAAECARDQDKFREYVDALFAHQNQLDEPAFRQYAADTGLDVRCFNACMTEGKKTEIVEADIREGIAQHITGVPTFFVGDGRYRMKIGQPITYKQLQDAIEQRVQQQCGRVYAIPDCGTLANFPDCYVHNGAPNVTPVGPHAGEAADIVSLLRLQSALTYIDADGQTKPVRWEDPTPLDVEMGDPYAQNILTVGSPCINSVSATFYDNPIDCTAGLVPREGRIRLFRHGNGHSAIVVDGYSSQETRLAAGVLAQRHDELRGTEARVMGDTVEMAVIQVVP